MAYRTKNFDNPSPFFLLCEHADNYVPEKYNKLGVSDEDLQKHFAWDPGAGPLTEVLSDKLSAPALFGDTSRLVIDVNRSLDHPTLISPEGEGLVIPGNQNLSEDDRRQRIDEVYVPFHEAVSSKLDSILQDVGVPLTLSIHSFNPVFFNHKRIWDIGFLWAQDSRLSDALYSFFEKRGFIVGDNEPYDARKISGTGLNKHCDSRRIPNVTIEVRNDLIDTEEKVEKWAALLAEALKELESDGSMFLLYDGPEAEFDVEDGHGYFKSLAEDAKSSGTGSDDAVCHDQKVSHC